MGFPTKVQLIKRKSSVQWYINFPSALAQAMDFARGETVEWSIEDNSLLALRRLNPPPSALKKNSAGILSSLQTLWREGAPAFAQQRVADRTQALSLSSLLCLGRHTLTGLLTTSGGEFQDWSAAYRIFSQNRLPAQDLFAVVRRAVLAELPPHAPLTVAVDDSLLRKSGLPIPGVAWRRDPLGPPFQTNFVRAQRFLQLSASIPLSDGAFRMVPIAFRHAPTPPKPPHQAPAEAVQQYRKTARLTRLPLVAAQQIAALRQALDAQPGGSLRPLHIVVDGGYTNATVLKKLPDRTVLIGRIRKDAQLYFPPESSSAPASPHRGRPRHYGAPAPTPEQIRTEEARAWSTIDISVSGAPHSMRIKRLGPVLWRTAGLGQVLQLVVIAPLRYRLADRFVVVFRLVAARAVIFVIRYQGLQYPWLIHHLGAGFAARPYRVLSPGLVAVRVGLFVLTTKEVMHT